MLDALGSDYFFGEGFLLEAKRQKGKRHFLAALSIALKGVKLDSR